MLRLTGSSHSSLHKPAIEGLLKAVGLDVVYHRAEGDQLYYYDELGCERVVLDFVGGYGTLMLGHNHPDLIDEARRFYDNSIPNHTQGSLRSGAMNLARVLSERLGRDYCCVFANSGCEAVEAALKHASLETRANTWITLERGFHGKTKGALEVTANAEFREPFGIDARRVVRIAAGDTAQLRRAFSQHSAIAGFLFEPIQGEGGIRPVDSQFLHIAEELCAERNIPFIADECQTGMGRTGTFLACERIGLRPNYILLSKALGGGVAKISAVLIEQNRYRSEFELSHSSTFADDEFSCRIAHRTLQLIDSAALARVDHIGSILLDRLADLHQRYPQLIADVRGVGLLVGIELNRDGPSAGLLWRHLRERKLLGPLLAAFLFHRHGIRVAPTLGDSLTIRLQPSLLVSESHVEHLLCAIDDMCAQLSQHGVAFLSSCLPNTETKARALSVPRRQEPLYFFRNSTYNRDRGNEPDACPRKVAWIFHLPAPSHLNYLDPHFVALSKGDKESFVRSWGPFCEPLVMPTAKIHSRGNDSVDLIPILLPTTSRWLAKNARIGAPNIASQLVQRAIDVAQQLHCDVVTLGQFTSIVSKGGSEVDHRNMLVTCGSNYTAALIVEAIGQALVDRGLDPQDLEIAVVGAAGDIAGTCAQLLGPQFGSTLLVGSRRRDSATRLADVSAGIPRCRHTTNIHQLRTARVVVCATNCEPFLDSAWLHPDAIVCDASVPPALNYDVAREMPNVTVLPGGIVTLPHSPIFDIPGFPLADGTTFGCMAEGLLLGLENASRHGTATRWRGRSNAQNAIAISEIAARHGFGPSRDSSESLRSWRNE